jgi:hypothetical protein
MSMNWTQYLLGKLAEEATEVAKEALKCQQQGVASQYKGRNAIMELRNEFLETIAVLDMLEERVDVGTALGEHHLVPVTGHDVCQDDDYHAITVNKVYRLCYYAMFAYQSRNLDLTKAEFDQVRQNARCHIQLTGSPTVDDIVFRSLGIGSYYRDTIIDPPVTRPVGDVSIEDQAKRMEQAIALNSQLIEAEWDLASKEGTHTSQNTDGTVLYSWTDRDKDVCVHIHVKVEHYDVIHTDRKTGRHISIERGEYKTF